MSAEQAGRNEQSSDFEALDYLESERSEVEFFKDLETLLLEYLEKPSKYTALLNEDGRLVDFNNLSLIEMGERAEEKFRGSIRYDRIHAETDGLKGQEYFYRKMTENGVVVLVMPPGTKEEGFGKVSMTNISTVNKDGVVTTYTIPTKDLSVNELRGVVENASKDLNVETLPPDNRKRLDLILASHPMLIENGVKNEILDKLAFGLGFDNFEKLITEVNQALEKEDSPKAVGRRRGLLAYLAMQIVSFRDKRDYNGLMALGRTVRIVFALESTGSFDKLDEMEMIVKFKDYMYGFMYKQELDKSYPFTTSMDIMANNPNILQLRELHNLIYNNYEAREKLEGGSCGGGGWQELFKSKYGGDMVDLRNPSIIQDVLSTSESSKEENYSFDHEGECVVCKKDPKALGPCEICEECDHKIRAQMD